MQVPFLGRAPRTKETLPDFLKWSRVTRPPLVFRGLTGSQRTPGFWGVTTLTLRGSPTEYVDYGGYFMILNKLLEHGLQSSVLLSLSMVFHAVLFIQLFF